MHEGHSFQYSTAYNKRGHQGGCRGYSSLVLKVDFDVANSSMTSHYILHTLEGCLESISIFGTE